MRLIVRNRANLHVWNVGEYIKQTQANVVKLETNHFISMQNIFKKLYFRHLEQHQILNKLNRKLNNFVLMSEQPARAIADYFHKKSRNYSQDLMTTTFQHIAKAYKISQRDHNGTLDTLGYSLFLSSEFSNLSQELKYGLRNNKITFENLIAIGESLVTMEYVDYEIFNLLLLYTEREILSGDEYAPLSNWAGDRHYQIEKKNYYDPQEESNLQALRKSDEINVALGFVKHIYKEWQNDQIIKQELKEQGIEELNELIDSISQTSKNFRNIIEGIITIRRQYVKMVELSGREEVLRDPNLSLNLLLLEQKLMAVKLLSIQDIKNPKLIHDSDHEIRRIEEILMLYLELDKISPIFTLIDKSSIEVQGYKDREGGDPVKIASLLQLLSKLASLDRHVYHAHDGRSLINLKWQKTLIEQTPAQYISTQPLYEQLNVSRIFRRIYGEVISFVGKHRSKLDQIFKLSTINDRIQLMQAYCRLGLQLEAIVEGEHIEKGTTTVQVNHLSKKSFASLVHLFNDVGLFIGNDSLNSDIFNRLQKQLYLLSNNQLSQQIESTINAVNYLLQNHKNHPKYSQVYNGYVQLLQNQAIYDAPRGHEEEHLIQAFKVLALEKPQKYGSHPAYLTFLSKLAQGRLKQNPYFDILRETCYKWRNKDSQLKKLQTYLNLGVSKGVQNALVLSNSDETSIEGQIRSGNLNSFILRLQQRHKLNVHQFSTSSFLNINYGEQKIFQLKSKAVLQQKFNEIQQQQGKPFQKLFLQTETAINVIIQAYPQCLVVDKIKYKLAILDHLYGNNLSAQTKEQQISNQALFLLEILEVQKLVQLLQSSQILKTVPNKKPRNMAYNTDLESQDRFDTFEEYVAVDVHLVTETLNSINEKFNELIEAVSTYLREQINMPPSSEGNLLKGQRQTLELLGKDHSDGNLLSEFINYSYFADKTFCDYDDWRQKIEEKYSIGEFGVATVNNMSRILLNKFCPGVTGTLSFLPVCRHNERMKRLQLSFKLLREKQEKQAEEPATRTSITTKQLDYIINLQTFKHELKTTFTEQKLLQFILDFKFVVNLKKNTTDPRQCVLLPRESEEYFRHLEQIKQRQYLQSPYAQYIIKKLSKTDRLRYLLEERKKVRALQRMKYQQGSITAEDYYQAVGQVEDQILREVEVIKTKMLDHMQDAILDGQFKMFDIEKQDLEAFEKIVRNNISYSRQFDSDFIYANGNYQKALNLKRGRAQKNFISFYLLKKLAQKEPLPAQQVQLLREWHNQIEKSIYEFVVYEDYSKMAVSDLSWEDLQSLKLQSSSLNSNRDMLIIDLIMQLNLFLDQSILESYERQVKAQIISRKYGIPLYLFEQSASNGFKHQENLIEAAIISDHSKLQQKDLSILEGLFKIFKTEGFRERQRYQQLCSNFRPNVEMMNDQLVGQELIEEYIRALEEQFMKEYDPRLLQEIKQKQTDILWREIFHHPYERCSKEHLKEISKKIIIRMELLNGKTPPFFGNLILELLSHPQLDPLTKETIIAAIQMFKVDLNIDSSEIEKLARMKGRQQEKREQAKEKLLSVARGQVGRTLLMRAQQVI